MMQDIEVIYRTILCDCARFCSQVGFFHLWLSYTMNKNFPKIYIDRISNSTSRDTMDSTTCEINLSITVAAVALAASVLIMVLTIVGAELTRRQKQLILTLRRQLAKARRNKATSAFQVQPPHPAINTDQQHHSSPQEPVYADIQEDNLTLTATKNVAYGRV